MSGDVHAPTNAGPDPSEPVRSYVPPPAGGVDVGGADEAERPEILVGAAFAGGLIAALIIKRLGGSDDD
jgi:hypothetical protein